MSACRGALAPIGDVWGKSYTGIPWFSLRCRHIRFPALDELIKPVSAVANILYVGYGVDTCTPFGGRSSETEVLAVCS